MNSTGQRPPHVVGDSDVVRLLLERRASGSAPGERRRDPYRVALVIGGGGMRGAYVAGMLRALEREGLRDAFDDVYGSSSGAASAAAFLTGAAHAGAACFPEDLADRRFLDKRRLLAAAPVVSLDYFLDDVLAVRKPLAWDELTDAAIPLHVIATDVEDLAAYPLFPQTVADWKLAIRASATIPLLAGPPVRFAGRRWIDGSVAEPLATARALADGATHVLVLLCRGLDELDPRPVGPLRRRNRIADHLVRGLGTLTQGTRRYTADLLDIEARLRARTHPGERVLAVCPATASGVTSLSIDRERVGRAVVIGDDSLVAVLQAQGTVVPNPRAASVTRRGGGLSAVARSELIWGRKVEDRERGADHRMGNVADADPAGG